MEGNANFDASRLEHQVLGVSNDVLRSERLADLQTIVDHMTAQARNDLCILAPNTEPELYGRDAFARLVADLIANRGRVARVRLLIADPARARHSSHALVMLWHRFPSFIDVRELRDIYASTREAFLLVDSTGLIRREEMESWAAVSTYKNLTTARDRATWFDEAWARSAPCSALRRLGL